MKYPCLEINLNKISNNCKIINDRCAKLGISVVGVTKCVSGDTKIAETLKEAGISIFGDSRLKNLHRLRSYFGNKQRLILLRTPMLSEIEDMIEICDTSINTQFETVRKISESCLERGLIHKIMVMVEIDDRREGLLPCDVANFCGRVMENCKNIRIIGLATNARCISTQKPTVQSLNLLTNLKKEIKDKYGIDIPVISGGNSSIWSLVEEGSVPPEVNQVRIGEAILFGHETTEYKPIEGAYRDAFVLKAEIIEIKKKNGEAYKAILALGIQDVDCKNIWPCDSNFYILDQSSDHTVIGLKCALDLKIGDTVSFNLNYFGVLSCMASPFVFKEYV